MALEISSVAASSLLRFVFVARFLSFSAASSHRVTEHSANMWETELLNGIKYHNQYHSVQFGTVSTGNDGNEKKKHH